MHTLVDHNACVVHSDIAALGLTWIVFVPAWATGLGPARLSGASEHGAPFLGPHVAPARGTEADRLSAYGRGSEFATGEVEYLQRQIEQDLRRQRTLSHDAPKRRGSPHAEIRGQRRRNRGTCLGAFFRC